MAWRSGSLSRSLMSTARASLRPSPPSPLPRLRPPPLTAPLPRARRFSSATSRSLGELGCAQSLLPLHNTSTCLTSHFAVSARACCELSHDELRHWLDFPRHLSISYGYLRELLDLHGLFKNIKR